MGRLIVLPETQKPETSSSVKDWTKGGVVQFSSPERFRVDGSVSCANGYTIGGPNTNGDRSGDIYLDSNGFYSNVYTKQKNKDWYTTSYIGSGQLQAISGGVVNGGKLTSTTVASNTSANWTKNVKGFFCEISGKPTSGDGCGKIKGMTLAGVFVNSNGYIKVYDMVNKGVWVLGHKASDEFPSDKWVKMCYYAQTNDMLGMHHLGWVVQFHHQKTCGGGQESKNCTGRIRYLQPLISSHGGLYYNKATEHQIIMKRRNWTDRDKYQLFVV